MTIIVTHEWLIHKQLCDCYSVKVGFIYVSMRAIPKPIFWENKENIIRLS